MNWTENDLSTDDYENKEMAYNEKYAEYKPLEDELIQAQNDLDALKSQRDEIQNEIDEILPEGKTRKNTLMSLGQRLRGAWKASWKMNH